MRVKMAGEVIKGMRLPKGAANQPRDSLHPSIPLRHHTAATYLTTIWDGGIQNPRFPPRLYIMALYWDFTILNQFSYDSQFMMQDALTVKHKQDPESQYDHEEKNTNL